jgi:hypothetical protein
MMVVLSKALAWRRLYRSNRRSLLGDGAVPAFGVDDRTEVHVCGQLQLELVSSTRPSAPLPPGYEYVDISLQKAFI